MWRHALTHCLVPACAHHTHADALVGKPGSKLLLRTGARLRLACASARDTEGVLNNTPRSKLVASPGSKEPQRFLTANVTFKVTAVLVVWGRGQRRTQ